MFTGLVTDVGRVRSIEKRGDLRLVLETHYDMASVDIGASIACNGVCLTVVDKDTGWFAVDASEETCQVTTLKDWSEGTPVNFERSLKLGDEMGGHIVSGHVDTLARVAGIEDVGGSHVVTFTVSDAFGHLLADKGSVAVNGVSLTVNSVLDGDDGLTRFTVNIIPHTWDVTAFKGLTVDAEVNIEFDLLARYVARLNARG